MSSVLSGNTESGPIRCCRISLALAFVSLSSTHNRFALAVSHAAILICFVHHVLLVLWVVI